MHVFTLWSMRAVVSTLFIVKFLENVVHPLHLRPCFPFLLWISFSPTLSPPLIQSRSCLGLQWCACGQRSVLSVPCTWPRYCSLRPSGDTAFPRHPVSSLLLGHHLPSCLLISLGAQSPWLDVLPHPSMKCHRPPGMALSSDFCSLFSRRDGQNFLEEVFF